MYNYPFFNNISNKNINISKELFIEIITKKSISYYSYIEFDKYKSEKDIIFLNKYKEKLFHKNITFIVLDYIDVNGTNNYFITLGESGENIEDGTFLNKYIVDIYDEKKLYNIIQKEGTNVNTLFFGNESFYCFLNGGFYWYCPIEYYIKEKNGKKDILSTSPYKYVEGKLNKILKQDLLDNGFESIFIGHKEKFARWVFEGIYFNLIDNGQNNSFKTIDNIKKTQLYYKLYFYIDKYLYEYKQLNPLTTIEDINEWKNGFII